MTEYAIDPERSSVVVEARSSVGPIAWDGRRPAGRFSLAWAGADVADEPAPVGRLDLDLDRLTSGNRVYDAELLRRMEARRYPTATVALEQVGRRLTSTSFEVTGAVTIHGRTNVLRGSLTAQRQEDGSVMVTGAQVVDIRDFGVPPPSMLMLKIYPDVHVHLVVVGTPVD